MNNILTNDQVSTIVDILTQYAPEGWTELKMHLVTDEAHTEVTTWAVTDSDPKYGFHLDSEDRPVLDELIDGVWETGGRAWSQMDFSVSSDGDFSIEAK